jgi:hypothetical protein
VPHAPQFALSVAVFTHAPAHTISGDGHVTVHLPAEHASPAAQTFPQTPQFDASFARSVHRPLHNVSVAPHVGFVSGGVVSTGVVSTPEPESTTVVPVSTLPPVEPESEPPHPDRAMHTSTPLIQVVARIRIFVPSDVTRVRDARRSLRRDADRGPPRWGRALASRVRHSRNLTSQARVPPRESRSFDDRSRV